jgi:ATP-binding cassette subfamily F protein 3
LLEHFLADFSGGYLVVSHDREFLKRTCEETLEIENGAMTLFPGPVHDYLVFKAEQKELAGKINRNLEMKQRQLERFIERFKSKASKATQAKSKMKQLERLKAMEIESDCALSTVSIHIPEVETRSGMALRTTDLAIGYPNRRVASHITWDINRGEHVAILGENGQGKTTLLRTLAGEIPPLEGTFHWGHGLSFGYYAQHVYSSLPNEGDVFSVLTAAAPASASTQQILDMAGAFLFKGDDVKKPVSVLSGGERSRVCLAALLLAGKPVLLLDEPTNHLDFETVEALGFALQHYNGTLFFISHDRTFVNLVATSILEVQNGRIIRYPGTYEEYVYSLECRVEESLAQSVDSAGVDRKQEKPVGREEERISRYELRKNLQSEIRKWQKKVQQCEQKLGALQQEIARMTRLMEENPASWTWEASSQYETLKKSLGNAENEWLELHSEIEKMEKELSEL